MLKHTIFLFLFFLSYGIYSQSNFALADHEIEDISSYTKEVCIGDTCRTRFITGELFQEIYKVNGRVNKVIKYFKNGNYKSHTVYSTDSYFNINSSIYWYENGNKKETGKMVEGKFRVINFWDSTGTLLVKEGFGKMLSYYKGQIDFKGEYKNGLKDGNWYYGHYYGQYYEQGNYIEGKKQGEWIAMNYDGTPIWKEVYSDDKFMEGKRILKSGETIIYTELSTEANYPGGNPALAKDVMELMGNFRKHLEVGMRNRIMLSFTINKEGKIEELEVIQPKGTKLEEILLKAIVKTKPWNPAINRGYPVNRKVRIPFAF